MNDKKLIELVRGYPVLYDVGNPKYMDSDYKNAIWSKIGTEIETDGSLCKTRWANIRDNFRKSLNKQKTKTGKKGTKVKLYKYSEQMNFLKIFFEEKVTKTNTTELINADFTIDKESEEPENDDSTAEVNDLTMHNKPTDTIPPPRKTRRLSVPNQTPPMEYIVERNKSINYPPPAQHPVDAFLAGLAPVLKKLSQRDWHFAKGEIFATAQKYEFNMLMNQQQQQRSVDPLASSMCSTEMCSSEQPSSEGSYLSTSWNGKQSSLYTVKNEENATPDLTL